MNNDDQKIFKPPGNRWNACLQNYIDFSLLARYYLESANALIEITFSDSSKLDVYVYSAVFLYRHSVELWLKELIWMSNYILGRGKTFPKMHNLMDLWRPLKSNATSLLTSDFPLNKKEVQYVETTIEEINKYDPESYAFRYPFNKKMVRTHPNVNHVNVKALYERFNQLHEYLGRISYMVDHLYSAQSERHEEQKGLPKKPARKLDSRFRGNDK
jgi:hypothetical protein